MTHNRPMYAIAIQLDGIWITTSKNIVEYRQAMMIRDAFAQTVPTRLYRLVPQMVEETIPPHMDRDVAHNLGHVSAGRSYPAESGEIRTGQLSRDDK